MPTSTQLDQWSAEAFALINSLLGVSGATKALASRTGAGFQAAAMVATIQYNIQMLNVIRLINREDVGSLEAVANYQLVRALTQAQKAMLIQACAADDGRYAANYNMETGAPVSYGQPFGSDSGAWW